MITWIVRDHSITSAYWRGGGLWIQSATCLKDIIVRVFEVLDIQEYTVLLYWHKKQFKVRVPSINLMMPSSFKCAVRALETANLMAPACPVGPPPLTRAETSTLPSISVTDRGNNTHFLKREVESCNKHLLKTEKYSYNYTLCCVMENTEIWLADTRNKVTFMKNNIPWHTVNLYGTDCWLE